MLNYNSEEIQSSISKFEKMLKTNLIYFFDAQEFEDIKFIIWEMAKTN